MDRVSGVFLEILKRAVADKKYSADRLAQKDWEVLIRLARQHYLLPMVAETVRQENPEKSAPFLFLCKHAVKETEWQAHRTAEFLLLYDYLAQRGLHPVIAKGIILRSLYPRPEQRASADEDFLIRPGEVPAYRRALLDYGLDPIGSTSDDDNLYEAAYEDKERGLYIEVHKAFFDPSSPVFGNLNIFFDGTCDRSETVKIYGTELTTLAPTDHLLYMLCHAYKHFLYGGVGIRQVCDIGLFADRFKERIDWSYISACCEKTRISLFAAAVFRIAQSYLGFFMPAVFEAVSVDETDLLNDILTGGLYGVEDINRAHSATITLDAVLSQRVGKKSSGLLAAAFPPLRSMEEKYSYLKNHPWLLPMAWVQRTGNYLFRHKKKTDPTESLRIGRERVALLKEYGIIE